MAAGWLDEEECHCEDAATAEAMINALRKVAFLVKMSFFTFSARNVMEFKLLSDQPIFYTFPG